jgi:hypothetical protein
MFDRDLFCETPSRFRQVCDEQNGICMAIPHIGDAKVLTDCDKELADISDEKTSKMMSHSLNRYPLYIHVRI